MFSLTLESQTLFTAVDSMLLGDLAYTQNNDKKTLNVYLWQDGIQSSASACFQNGNHLYTALRNKILHTSLANNYSDYGTPIERDQVQCI